MAKACVLGHCFTDINLNKPSYTAMLLGVIKNLCCDVILGQYFQKEHRSVIIKFGGAKPDLVIPNLIPECALSEASLGEPSLFANLLPSHKPNKTKSWCFSKDDQAIIHHDITHLLTKNIIKPNTSHWWAQVVVVRDPLLRHKQRLCVDYLHTINQYSELNGYPLPWMHYMGNTLCIDYSPTINQYSELNG